MPEEFIEDILIDADADTKSVEKTKSVEETKLTDEIKLADETKVLGVAAKDDTNKDATNNDGKTSIDENASKDVATIEDLATQIGWNPNYKGENSIDAATYILKSREIQDTMKDQNTGLKDQLTNMQSSVDALKEHNERVYKTDVRRMESEIETLKNEKRAAVELADVAKVDAIDKKIDDLEKDLTKPKSNSKSTETTNSVYNTWVKDNQWYLIDPDMATYAESVAQQYQGAPLDRIYSIIRQKVAEVFPEKFATPSAPAAIPAAPAKPVGPASPVEAATNNAKPSIFTKANLTSEQISIMNQFTKTGVMTEEQYIKDIAKMQGE